MAVNSTGNDVYKVRYGDYTNVENSTSASSVNGDGSIINPDNTIVSNDSSGAVIENSGGIDNETYEQIVKDLQNKIEQKKQEIQDTKKNRGWLSSIGNGIAQAFGGGDKSKQAEIAALEAQLKSLDSAPENISAVYKNIMGKDLDVTAVSSLKESNTIAKSLSSDQNKQVQDLLTQQYQELEQQFKDTKSQNGWISGGWDKFKNWTGIGASSNKTQTQLDNMKKELDDLKNHPENLAQAYKNITGKDLNNEELTKLANGETSLSSSSKASTAVKKYADGQKMVTDVVADVVSGIVAVAAVAAAPFTGGASLLLAAGVGAAIKVGLKASDCIGTTKTYGMKDLAYDAVTGSINGLMAPITAGAGGVVGTTVAKQFGLEAVESTAKAAMTQAVKTAGKEVAEEAIEQTVKQGGKTFLTNVLAKQGTKYVLKEGTEATTKTFLGKTLAYGADMAVDGAMSGATDGFARALGEGRLEDIPQDMLNGAVGGLIAAPVIGGGFKIAGRAGSKISNEVDVLKAASRDAKINFKNIPNVESPDIELARNLGDIVKQARSVVDDVKLKNTNISDEFLGSVDNMTSEMVSFVGTLQKTNESFNVLSNEYKEILGEALTGLSKGEDVSDKVLNLAAKLSKYSEDTQSVLNSASLNIEKSLEKIAKSSEMVNERASNYTALYNDTAQKAADMANSGLELVDDFANSNIYKQLGTLPGDVKEMVSSFRSTAEKISQQQKKLNEMLQRGIKEDDVSELSTCYQELESFNSLLNEQIGQTNSTVTSSSLFNTTKLIKDRYDTRQNSELFSQLSSEQQAQAIIEDTNIALSKFIQTLSSDEGLPPDLQEFFKGFTSNCTVSRTMSQAQALTDELYGSGKYTLVESFGAGTIGETYLVKDQTGKEFVIKMLKEGVTPQKFKEDRAMFIDYVDQYITNDADKEYKMKMIDGLFDSWDKELNFALEAQGSKNLANGSKRFDVAQTLEVGTKNGQNISLVMEKAEGVRLDSLISMLKVYKEDPQLYFEKFAKKIEANPWLKDVESWKKDLPIAYQKAQNEQVMFVSENGTKTVHADPHGGNVFVNIDETGKPRITYIDTGNTVQRTNKEVLQDIGLSLNMMVGNSKGVVEAMLNGATLPKGMSREEIIKQFSSELDKRLFKAGVNLKNVNYTQNTINGIMKDLNIIPNSANSNLLKATLQRIKTSREIFSVTGTQSNKMIDIKDLGLGLLKSFKSNPIETLKTIKPIFSYIFHNDYDAMVVFFQMLQKGEA